MTDPASTGRSLALAAVLCLWAARALGDPRAIDLGQALFNTEWLPAGVASEGRSSSPGTGGLGPLFNIASCAGCHPGVENGHGPAGDGLIPLSLEIQLGSIDPNSNGDPVYGRIFNTAAVPGLRAEGRVTVRYGEIYGYYYPDGTRWSIRVPHYELTELSHGPLLGTTVIKPRVAPPLFGTGLLELVAEAAISNPGRGERGAPVGVAAWHVSQGVRSLGRFGWQADALTIRDQTTRAMAREMGLTSVLQPHDDCTPAETDCYRQPGGVSPEVSEQQVDVLVAYVRSLAVPPPTLDDDDEARFGHALFESIGCAACHRLQSPVTPTGDHGRPVSDFIQPYTDLRLHNLGSRMSDETVSGQRLTSLWRTPPLWGLGYRIKSQSQMTYLHDGRARSVEEAILWHGGEAARSRRNFMEMGPQSRRALLRWVENR